MATPMRSKQATRAPAAESDARTRLLETAYTLFSRHGIQRIGIDRIIAEAGIAKMTLYRHFASKDELVLAFLELRGQRWTLDWLAVEIERRGSDPLERLLVPFDVLDGWFRSPDFEGCAFMRTLFEVPDEADPVHVAAVRHLDTVKAMLAGNAEQAGIARADEIALQIQTLMMGSIVSATRGDREAARRARVVAERLLEGEPRAA
jgi:AcrR family transcriptional regulator